MAKEKVLSKTEVEIIELRKLIRQAQEFLQHTRHSWNGPIHRAAFMLQKAMARKIPFDIDAAIWPEQFNQHVLECEHCKLYAYTKCPIGTAFVESFNPAKEQTP